MSNNRIDPLPSIYLNIVSVTLMISVPIRMLERKYNLPFSTHFLIMIISGSFGILVGGVPYLDGKLLSIGEMQPDLLIAICLPSYLMTSIHKLDSYVLVRTLPATLITSMVIFILNSITLGFVMQAETLNDKYALSTGLLAAVCLIPIQPYKIIEIMKELSKYNYMSTVMEVESALTLVPILMVHEICVGFMDLVLTEWYQFLLVIIRLLFGGLLWGAILGKITSFLLVCLYHDPLGAISISISSTYLTYFVGQYILAVSGCFSLIIFAWILCLDRPGFSTEVDKSISQFWATFSYAIDLCFQTISIIEIMRLVYDIFDPRSFLFSMIVFCSITIVRLAVYLLLRLFTKKMAYEINLRCLMIMGLSGVKGSHGFLLVLCLVTHESTIDIGGSLLDDVVATVLLTQLINNSSIRLIMRLLGLDEISVNRKTNMNSCMKFIMDKRNIILNILKTNKYMTYAEWKIVLLETIIKHPYSSKSKSKDIEHEDDDDLLLDVQGSILCPDCLREVAFDISKEELLEMTQEGKIKILKAKKVTTIKQYESGMIDKSCMQVLLHNFEILLESTVKDKGIDISKFFKSNKCLKSFRIFFNILQNNVKVEIPKHRCGKLCYYIIMHIGYDFIHTSLTLLHGLLVLISRMTNYNFEFNSLAHLGFCLVLLLDLIIKLIGLTTERSMCSGFKQYFKFFWYWFDFILLLTPLMGLLMVWIGHPIGQKILFISAYVRFFRFLYFLRYLLPIVVRRIENKIDSNICFGYQLSVALLKCHEEILDLINQIIELKVIRNIHIKEMTAKKQALNETLEQIQRVKPWIAITVKTKQAIRSTIVSMEEALTQLKISGFVDNIEYDFIYEGIVEKKNFLRKLKFVRPCSPKVIFKEVPWMDESILEFLYNNVLTVTWDAGEIICTEGKFVKGIYILVTGLLRVKYTPREIVLENLRIYGRIPIIDYLSKLEYDKYITDTIMSGNSFGELSMLTGRPYDCTIVAEIPSKAYLITLDLIRRAMKFNRDPITGLEARMWKSCTINLAVAALMEIPLYQGFSSEQIKIKVEKAFSPNLKCYKIFVITELMGDVILIEGVAADYNTGEYFSAPMVIPRTIQKLILPRSSFMNKGEGAETRLFIIPLGDVNVYEIMENEEEVAELVSIPSSKCLLHAVQKQTERKHKKLKQSTVEIDSNVISKVSGSSLPLVESAHSKLIEVIDIRQSSLSSISSESSDEDNRKGKRKRFLKSSRRLGSRYSDHLV